MPLPALAAAHTEPGYAGGWRAEKPQRGPLVQLDAEKLQPGALPTSSSFCLVPWLQLSSSQQPFPRRPFPREGALTRQRRAE